MVPGDEEDSADAVSEIIVPAEITVEENTYTVREIEEDAFSGLAAETLYIPESVTEFGPQILKNLRTIEVSEENPVLYTEKGVLFRKNNNADMDAASEELPIEDEKALANAALLLYPAASDAESYVVPWNTGEIAEKAFAYSSNLKTIVFTEGLHTIKANAVMSVKNSVEVAFAMETMPGRIDEAAFYLDGADGNVIYFADEANATVAADARHETIIFNVLRL